MASTGERTSVTRPRAVTCSIRSRTRVYGENVPCRATGSDVTTACHRDEGTVASQLVDRTRLDSRRAQAGDSEGRSRDDGCGRKSRRRVAGALGCCPVCGGDRAIRVPLRRRAAADLRRAPDPEASRGSGRRHPRPPARPGRAAGRGARSSYMDVGLDVGQRRLADAGDVEQLVDAGERDRSRCASPGSTGAVTGPMPGSVSSSAWSAVLRSTLAGAAGRRAGQGRWTAGRPGRGRGTSRPTTICSPSTSGRARLRPAVSTPGRAPPAAARASITRDPGGSSTIPGRRTLPATSTTRPSTRPMRRRARHRWGSKPVACPSLEGSSSQADRRRRPGTAWSPAGPGLPCGTDRSAHQAASATRRGDASATTARCWAVSRRRPPSDAASLADGAGRLPSRRGSRSGGVRREGEDVGVTAACGGGGRDRTQQRSPPDGAALPAAASSREVRRPHMPQR